MTAPLTVVSLFAGVGGIDLAAERVEMRMGDAAARYRQIGNSVAVPVFEWVLGRLAAAAGSLGAA